MCRQARIFYRPQPSQMGDARAIRDFRDDTPGFVWVKAAYEMQQTRREERGSEKTEFKRGGAARYDAKLTQDCWPVAVVLR
jgi:hypothetical protein